MIRLVLVRHAKSDWGDPSLDDHDRPLNNRGRRDAPVMAGRLASTGFVPDAILSSTALRARTTAAVFGEEFGVDVRLDGGLYLAPAGVLLRAAATAGNPSVIVVAHDPGITVLAAQLSGGVIPHMPTCAVASFTWNTDDWDVATALEADSTEFMTPRGQ